MKNFIVILEETMTENHYQRNGLLQASKNLYYIDKLQNSLNIKDFSKIPLHLLFTKKEAIDIARKYNPLNNVSWTYKIYIQVT